MERARRGASLGRLAALAVAACAAGCALLVDTSGLSGGPRDAASGADATTDDAGAGDAALDAAPGADASDASDASKGGADAEGVAEGGSPACPAGRGPAMLRVDTAAGAFCVDTTEVTAADYAAFLATSPSTATQPPECAFNTSFVPYPPSADAGPVWPVADGRRPVVGVDWCDARAFCRWAGKRLCGAIGGGPNPMANYNVASTSQWFAACSRGGEITYPYGNAYDATSCNVLRDGGDIAPAGSFTGCNGGYPGIFDMAGNVEEWEDSCDGTTGPNDHCFRRGGSVFDSPPQTLTRCDTPWTPPTVRSRTDRDVGFRCCAD